MPRNTGTAPKVERVDIRYRCGGVARDIDPTKRRWTLNDSDYPPNYAYDIEHWQEVK